MAAFGLTAATAILPANSVGSGLKRLIKEVIGVTGIILPANSVGSGLKRQEIMAARIQKQILPANSVGSGLKLLIAIKRL